MAPSLILTPNFDMEKTFFIRNQMEKIKDNKRKLEKMREELAGRIAAKIPDVKVIIEHVMLSGDIEAVLIQAEGYKSGVCVEVEDLMSGEVTMKQAVEAVLGIELEKNELTADAA